MIPFLLLPDCFVKKVTVIGIIGNTHGVKSAANPHAKPVKKIIHKLMSGLLLLVSEGKTSSTSSVGVSTFFETVSTLAGSGVSSPVLLSTSITAAPTAGL